jgi:hypothetical protein
MAEPLRDPEYFRRVRVDSELRTIVWRNGFDLDPDALHGDYEAAAPPDSVARDRCDRSGAQRRESSPL